MPFKTNADRRHHIPCQQHRIKNWAEYDAGLRARGGLTVWFTAEVPSREVLEMAVGVSGAMTVSGQAARSILLVASG